MIRHLLISGPLLLVLSSTTFAQETAAAPEGTVRAATIMAAESQEYGRYLVDGESRTVYLFTADSQGQNDAEAAASNCHDACAEAWPPVLTQGDPMAGEAVVQDLLGSIVRRDGAMQVTYNGWPLYYYVQDQGAGETTGQDIESFGGEWYLVRPEGEKLGHE